MVYKLGRRIVKKIKMKKLIQGIYMKTGLTNQFSEKESISQFSFSEIRVEI